MADEWGTEQASVPQLAADALRARGVALPWDKKERAWELHLRGESNSAIARELELDRGTVARYINACYLEVDAARKASVNRKLSSTVARLRRIQAAAWADHDADDARELHVLRTFDARENAENETSQAGKTGKKQAERQQASVRYQSQRAAYLRVILDAEKEIARVLGVYDAPPETGATVTFHITRRDGGHLSVTSAANRPMLEAGSDGDSDSSSE